MKRKHLITTAAAIAMTTAMSITAFAAGWQQNTTGWWYATDGAGTQWHANGWQWIDGDNDGVAECYYFDENGYMLTRTTTPDGCDVNGDGAWTIDGFIQRKNVSQTAPAENTDTIIPTGYNANGISNVVIDMLDNTRAQNAAKYGEKTVVLMGGEPLVHYENGFSAHYNSDDDNEMTYDVVGVYTDSSEVFRDATSAADADAAAQMLKNKGYDAYSNGVVAVINVDKYQLGWYGFGSNPRVKVFIMDKYRKS